MTTTAGLQAIIEQQAEIIRELRESLAKTDDMLDKAVAALDAISADNERTFFKIIDDPDPLRIKSSTDRAELRRVLAAALPVIHTTLLSLEESCFHA
jgi:hypothetical protein